MTMTEMLEPDLLRLRAPNPSPLTGSGTNAYVLGQRSCVVIDPGPDIDAHRDAILAACAGRPVEAILVTHSHRDHSTLAPKLAAEVDAPVCAFGPAEAGRSARMTALVQTGHLEGGEGLDHAFVPDTLLTDGADIALEGEPITALHTPGHLGNHLCYAWRGALFSGDHVMDWSTTLISPPDGDLTDFMASCARLAARQDRVYYPGHGDPVTDPAARVSNLIAHRKSREMQVLAALRSG
ncbi:MAG: MBL fold metallo-hydrolase, partial [Pseudomonadota bacterium]